MISRSQASKLIPVPAGKSETKFRAGSTKDIISVIMMADEKSREYTELIAPYFQGITERETCRNIFDFVKKNVKYVADSPGHERIKSPAQLWADGYGDCKSFSIFVGSILQNLGIPYKYRFAGYKGDSNYTHVYVITDNCIIDAVHDKFDAEVPYNFKKDKMTKISYVHGPQAETPSGNKFAVPAGIPPKPFYNWYAMTDGEFRAQLLRENLELRAAGSGDPSGEYEEAIYLIDKIGPELHYLEKPIQPTSRSAIVGYIAKQLNIAKQKRTGQIGGYKFIRGNRPEWAQQGDGPWPENFASAFQFKGNFLQTDDPGAGMGFGPQSGRVYWRGNVYDSWEHLFFNSDFDCHFDLATSGGPWPSNNKGRRSRDVVRDYCRQVKKFLLDLNRSYEEMAHQFIYNFVDPIPGKTFKVRQKEHVHKEAVQLIGHYASISVDNMNIWTRNGVIREGMKYSDGAVDPEKQIEIIKSGAGYDKIGEPITILGLTVVQIVSLISVALAVVETFRKKEDIEGLSRQLERPALEVNSAGPDDWMKENETSNLLIPALAVGAGALLLN